MLIKKSNNEIHVKCIFCRDEFNSCIYQVLYINTIIFHMVESVDRTKIRTLPLWLIVLQNHELIIVFSHVKKTKTVS